MSYSIIVAYDEERGIGKNGKIPWRSPKDMKRFKELTMNNTILMGRKTWESLPKKPLPGRKNVIISKTMSPLNTPDVIVFNDIERAFDYIALENGFVIGGRGLYEMALKDKRCKKLYVTEIPGKYDCDVVFPQINTSWFELVQSEPDGFLIYVNKKTIFGGSMEFLKNVVDDNHCIKYIVIDGEKFELDDDKLNEKLSEGSSDIHVIIDKH